ncbi:MAG: nuclear transport factor 2 family protein [Pseudoxanthomonas sp.]
MPDPSAHDIKVLHAAYAAFNARDIAAATALMTADVTWPKAFKGGVVQGPDEIGAYWTEQWSEIDPHVAPTAFFAQGDAQVLVDVHQVVRSFAGTVLADEHVGHCFTFKDGLICAMELRPLPAAAAA